MQNLFTYLRITVLLLVALSLGWLANLLFFRPFDIKHFYERVFWVNTWASPMSLTELRLLEAYGIEWHNSKLDAQTDEAKEQAYKRARKHLDILHAYDTTGLSAANKVSYDIMDYLLTTELEGEKFQYHAYPVNQMFGAHTYLVEFMSDMHQLNNADDAERYLDRLAAVEEYMTGLNSSLQHRLERGIMPPKFVVQRVRKQVDNILTPQITDNVLYKRFVTDVDKLKDADEADKTAFKIRCKDLVQEVVYKAYQKLDATLALMEASTNDEAGVWKLPNGDAFYAHMLKQQTTTNYTPEQIHNIGLAEVARIQHQMKVLLKGTRRDTTDLSKTMRALAAEPQFLYENTDAGRAQCLADYTRIIDSINTGIKVAFHTLPKSTVRVERIPAYKEAMSPMGYYNSPAADGSRPGIFYTRLDILPEIPKWSMATLSYHEAVPGHHFQIALQIEMKDLPLFRRYTNFNAYAEGWALYAERLAWELGYIRNVYEDLGRLQAELFRAVRLVVDTGIHKKRWPREEAITYMLNNTGMPESDVVSEIERYIVLPGQACGYKLGMLKILELREYMKQELGNDFVLADFHALVLNNGSMPLAVLEGIIKNHVAIKKAAKARA